LAATVELHFPAVHEVQVAVDVLAVELHVPGWHGAQPVSLFIK
jgi:hypothetical protein